MITKKGDHNTGASDSIKKFFHGKPYQEFKKKYLIKNLKKLINNLKNGAFSRNLIKSIKKYFIKNLIKNSKNGTLSKNLIKSIKITLSKPYQES